MKSFVFALALAAFGSALPTDVRTTRDVEIARDLGLDSDLQGRSLSIFQNDLEKGSDKDCPTAILIYARGSTEPGNMVRRPAAPNLLCFTPAFPP